MIDLLLLAAFPVVEAPRSIVEREAALERCVAENVMALATKSAERTDILAESIAFRCSGGMSDGQGRCLAREDCGPGEVNQAQQRFDRLRLHAQWQIINLRAGRPADS